MNIFYLVEIMGDVLCFYKVGLSVIVWGFNIDIKDN